MDIKLINKLFEQDLFSSPEPNELDARNKVAWPYSLVKLVETAKSLNLVVNMSGRNSTRLNIGIDGTNDGYQSIRLWLVFRCDGNLQKQLSRCKFERVYNIPAAIEDIENVQSFILT